MRLRSSGAVLLLAVAMDGLAGEPPTGLHPVIWMGRLLDTAEIYAPRGERARMAYGVLAAIGLPVLWAVAAAIVARRLPRIAHAALLKPTFAGRALLEAAHTVEHDLAAQHVSQARQSVKALVSRSTLGLDGPLLSSAAIESLAENLVDSWLAPLLMYALGGLPLAYAYRAANTADAMWGYRDVRYEQLGKAIARLDDVLNLIPARLAALLLMALAPTPRRALYAWLRDAHRTASPNAGQVMAATAGALDVRLEKPAHYVLNGQARAPAPSDIERARKLVRRAMLVAAVLCAAVAR